MSLKIPNIKGTSKELVVIADDKEIVMVISDSLKAGNLDMKVDRKHKRRPKIIVYEIARRLSQEELVTLIREKDTQMT